MYDRRNVCSNIFVDERYCFGVFMVKNGGLMTEFVIILEADGSYTINANCGEITIGENHDKERQKTTDSND